MKLNNYKYALLEYNTLNLGDYIQSIAANQFLPRVDLYLNRDMINQSDIVEDTKLILNGWFTHDPNGWPIRNDCIKPLFISFHISNEHGSSLERLTNSESIEYYKKNEPIGCRDFSTLNLLKSKSIEAYFSGCLTLSLKNRFNIRTNDIYFVDVEEDLLKLVPDHIKKNVNLLTHLCKNPQNVSENFRIAQCLLDKYSQAKLVVTSRLHCALPCVAFGTPVIFISKNLKDPRFGGLISLMEHYSSEEVGKENIDIDWDSPESNPVNIDWIRNMQSAICNNFIQGNKEGYLNSINDMRVNWMYEITNKRLIEMGKRIRSIDKQIKTAEGRAECIRKEIEEMHKSIAWRIGAAFRENVVEGIIPINTTRRRFYDRGLEDVKSLIKKANR